MSEETQGTILIVDDNEANRYVLSRLLTKHHYRVLEAATGTAGLAQLAGNPDIVILDIGLPDIHGPEVAAQIKANPLTSSVMILTTSANFTRTQDRIDALNRGADGFLPQPLDPPELLATIRALIRIRRAEEAMRQSNRDLMNFALTVSHDLQEPLRMVSSYLELLEHRAGPKLNDMERDYIRVATEGAGRMRSMVRDLLSLASTEQATVNIEPIAARDIVADALTNLSLKTAEAQASITVGELPHIQGDRTLLVQVFQNLISNGIKFRGVRTPRIEISAVTENGEHRFRIQDNGIGIDAAHLHRIFGLFQRLHTQEQYPGSGIGLALCKRIVERHHGRIGVTSQVGEGATFWFSIPA